MKSLIIVIIAGFLMASNAYSQESDCCSNDLSLTEYTKLCGTTECCEAGKTSGTSGTGDDSKCTVTGKDFDGAGASYTYLGKEYNFCCNGCIDAFKTEPIKYIGEELKCPVMGDNAKVNVSTEIDGVAYYFCCPSCIDDFTEKFDKYNSPAIEDHKH